MSKIINCECGEVIKAEGEDELVRKVENHVRKLDQIADASSLVGRKLAHAVKG